MINFAKVRISSFCLATRAPENYTVGTQLSLSGVIVGLVAIIAPSDTKESLFAKHEAQQ